MKRRYLLSAVIFALLILFFSVTPQPAEIKTGSYFDKVLHFCSYFVLAFLCYKAAQKFAVPILLAGTYGLLIEFLQAAIPYRAFEVSDIIVNYAGAGLILALKIFQSSETAS